MADRFGLGVVLQLSKAKGVADEDNIGDECDTDDDGIVDIVEEMLAGDLTTITDGDDDNDNDDNLRCSS